MQDSKPKCTSDFMCWAERTIWPHEDIAHVQITITTKDGHKHDYMHGSEGWGGIVIIDDVAPINRSLWHETPASLGKDFTGQYRDGEPER